MINTLSLKNFKAFEAEKFEFSSLNILSGLNNSGKSSVIQSLRLLHEQKPLQDLGPLDVYKRSDTKGFSLMCEQKIGIKKDTITFNYEQNIKESVKKGCIEGIVSYISADRLGPRNSLPLSIDENIAMVGSRSYSSMLSTYIAVQGRRKSVKPSNTIDTIHSNIIISTFCLQGASNLFLGVILKRKNCACFPRQNQPLNF